MFNHLIPLMQREWLQHRLAWALLVLIPLGLAALPLVVGQIDLSVDLAEHSGSDLAAILGLIAILATTAVIFLLVWVTSVFITSSLARRDHADRSVEFWLSLPSGHAESLLAPLLVHLILVPAAALLAGLMGGLLLSVLTVTRFVGIGEWFALPWSSIFAGVLSLVARVAGGLPLATLWLMPLILLAILANALFRRWGLPVLAVALGLGSVVLERLFGQPLLGQTLAHLAQNAGLSLAGASGQGVSINDKTPPVEALAGMPAWALHDFGAALQAAASPGFGVALLASAGLFGVLVLWRQRGAGHAG
jgi:ABC-2 type transport system permease protein